MAYSFDEDLIQQTIARAQAHHEESLNSGALDSMMAGGMPAGTLSLAAQCIKVSIEDHKICVSLPLGIGKVCIPLPVGIPSGTVAEACLHICTTFGIPTGVCVTVSVAGKQVAKQCFGKC